MKTELNKAKNKSNHESQINLPKPTRDRNTPSTSAQSDGKPVTWHDVLCTTNTKTKWAQWEMKFLEVAPMTFYTGCATHMFFLSMYIFPF